MTRLRPGDLVEVRAPLEILQTLDGAGTVDGLPFMPEMIEFCGRRFRVSKRVLKTCFSGPMSLMLGFRSNDVVTLDNVRCSGTAHDGCQKACIVFWRDAWLRKIDDVAVPTTIDSASSQQLRGRLKTATDPKTYFCQASELLNATDILSRWERLGKCLKEVRAGNCGTRQMARRIGVWLFWRLRRALLGPYGRGDQKPTPAQSLNLQRGDVVDVRSMKDISKTLDPEARNRGLWFAPGMRLACGGQQQVERRIERIIVDGTGAMRQLRNSVYLKGSFCSCDHLAFGGCPRDEFVYWREIWLHRVTTSGSNSG